MVASTPQSADVTGTESYIKGNNHGSPDTKISQTLWSEHDTNVVPSLRHIRRKKKARSGARLVRRSL